MSDSNRFASSSSSEGLATVPPPPPVLGGGVGRPSEDEDEDEAAAGLPEGEEAEFFGGAGACATESALSKGPGCSGSSASS